jgi:hypothetical protein
VNAENTDTAQNTQNNRKNKLFSVSFLLLALSAFTIFIAGYVPYMPPGILSVSGVVENILETQVVEYTVAIEESRNYSIDLEIKARGFVTAFRIADENGGLVLSFSDEGVKAPSIMNLHLEEGVYTVSILFLADYEAVEAYLESIGLGDVNARDSERINAALNRGISDYSAEYYIIIR